MTEENNHESRKRQLEENEENERAPKRSATLTEEPRNHQDLNESIQKIRDDNTEEIKNNTIKDIEIDQELERKSMDDNGTKEETASIEEDDEEEEDDAEEDEDDEEAEPREKALEPGHTTTHTGRIVRRGTPLTMSGRSYPRRGRGSRGRRGGRGRGGRRPWGSLTGAESGRGVAAAERRANELLKDAASDDEDRTWSRGRAASISREKTDISADSEPATMRVKEKGIRGRKPNAATLVAAQWVACDACGKWRRLPKHMNAERDLPDTWYCGMSTWDNQRNSCEAPEEVVPIESMDENSNGGGGGGGTLHSGGRGGGRWGRMERAGSTGSFADEENRVEGSRKDTPNASDDDEVVGAGTGAGTGEIIRKPVSTRGRGRGRGRGMSHLTAPRSPDRDSDNEQGGGGGGGVPIGTGRRGGRKPNVMSQMNSNSNSDAWTERGGGGGGGGMAMEEDDDDDDEGGGGPTRRPGPVTNRTTQSGSGSGSGNPSSSVIERVDWVQCNRCEKWRKVPISIDVSSLPDIWLCRLNFWDPAFARCSAREEVEDKNEESASNRGDMDEYDLSNTGQMSSGAPATPGTGLGRGRYPRRKPGMDVNPVMSGGMGMGMGSNNNFPMKKVTQWVQCERVSCKKWRKIPGTVDMSTLPEKWFCEMNRWDADRMTCEDAEESDSENEEPDMRGGGGGSLVFANSKGPGRLSYRRIIFGTDGKVRPSYSEKNKSGFGVFSFTDTHRPASHATQAADNVNMGGGGDEYMEPIRRIGYWWSSCYDESGALYVSSSRRGASTLGARRERETAESNAMFGDHHHHHHHTNGAGGDHRGTGVGGGLMMMKRNQMMSVCRTGAVPLALDCIRRYLGWEAPPPPTMKLKTGLRLRHISMLQRMVLECRIVIACLSQIGNVAHNVNKMSNDNIEVNIHVEQRESRSTPVVPVHTPVPLAEPVTLAALLSFIQSSWFHDEDMECCRLEFDIHSLRATVRRLEQDAELDVIYTANGQIAVQLFAPSVQHPSAHRRPRSDPFKCLLYGDLPEGSLLELSKRARPLRLRKEKYLKNIAELNTTSTIEKKPKNSEKGTSEANVDENDDSSSSDKMETSSE
eukprot:gene3254-6439_t